MVAADGPESDRATERITSEIRWHRDSGATQHRIGHRIEPADFVDIESADVQGRHGVPVRQRLDLVATFSVIGNEGAGIRIVSRLRDVELRECDACATAEGPVPRPTRLTTATRDSLDAFDEWRWHATTLGDDSTSRDFDTDWSGNGRHATTLTAIPVQRSASKPLGAAGATGDQHPVRRHHVCPPRAGGGSVATARAL